VNVSTWVARGIFRLAWSRIADRGVTGVAVLFVVLWVGLIVLAWIASRTTGSDVVVCMFKRVTGYPCATCGGTRAAMTLAKGDVLGAVQLNPLATLLVIGAPLLLAWWVLVPPGATAAGRWGRRVRPDVQVAILLAVVIANWAYVLWRFSRGEI